MNCAGCGAENPDGAKFCSACGTPSSRHCPACRAEVAPIARFCHECGAAIAASAGPALSPVAAPEPAALVERRHMSVMFCDLVGSVQMSRALDPEDLHDLIRAYRDACAEVVTRYEGTTAQFQGDGIVVYFGYPVAHEDDARRGVQAGLAVWGMKKGWNRETFALPPSLQKSWRLKRTVGLKTGNAPVRPA